MESDDDYQSFSPPEEPSPPLHHRKLKRLKKSTQVSNEPEAELTHDGASSPPLGSFKSEDAENSEGFEVGNELDSGFDDLELGEDRVTKRIVDFHDTAEEFDGQMPDLCGEVEENMSDLKTERIGKKRLNEEDSNESEGFDVDGELNYGANGLEIGRDRKETKRILDFGDVAGEFDRKRSGKSGVVEENIADLKMERLEKKRPSKEDSNENKETKKKQKKRVKSDGDDARPKTTSSTRRKEEKERKNYLQQLHAESQRLLRETRDATFKPIPVVQKPISSILEKIRQRKLEILKKTSSLQNKWSVGEDSGTLREDIKDDDSENASTRDKEVVQEETIACHADVEGGLDVSHKVGSEEAARQSSQENSPSIMAVDEQSMHAFRAPVDDTQDLFGDSQSSEGNDSLDNDQNISPLEEVLAPSLLAMNLQFDSAPPDDSSDVEEDNDKENVDPGPDRTDFGCSSPKGDPVKAFVDDEAVEEDDSDNDLMRFQENEDDEENGDNEDLKDLIATGYAEKPIDNERRNELHQQWLEQQDAAGTDNLLQRLKFGSELKDTTLLEEDEEEERDHEYDEEFGDEAAEDYVKTSAARINSRKAKQMIAHMFSDVNDGYLSDGEETEKMLVKQRLLDKAEGQVTLLSPAKDENSREVFGLIKKLNIVPDAKKKAKTSSFFDKMLTGRNNDGSSKSSFLGRATNHSLPLSHKKGTSTVRSFIFGRDDSNSRNSTSMLEDSSEVIPTENRPARNTTTKFSSSQSKVSTQSKKAAAATAEAVSGASLFEILKRSSMQSSVFKQDTAVGLTQSVYAAFKIPKKPAKIEGRS